MERLELEKKYTKEEIKEKFPEITTKTNELQVMLDWFNSPEAKEATPHEYTRRTGFSYPKIKGTDLGKEKDFTKGLVIEQAVRKRYVDLRATAQTTQGYVYFKDPFRGRAARAAEGLLVKGLEEKDDAELRKELEREINEEVERIKEEKE